MVCDDGAPSHDTGHNGGRPGPDEVRGLLLCHDEWDVDAAPRSPPLPGPDLRGFHPGYFEDDLGGGPPPAARPIEFRRRVLPAPRAKAVGPTAVLGAARDPGSPYSTLMREARMSRSELREGVQDREGQPEDNNSGGSHTDDAASAGVCPAADASAGGGIGANGEDGSNADDVGFVVEVFPVELHYVVMDGADNTSHSHPDDSDRSGPLSPTSRQGVALVSRGAPAAPSLSRLVRAATPPDRASACGRLWRRSPAATAAGDGYELLDLDDPNGLAPRPAAGPRASDPSSATASAATQRETPPPALTMEQWLGLEKLSHSGSSHMNGEGPVVVHLLVELRSAPTAKWSRGALQLGNRLQVRQQTCLAS